MPRKRKDGYLEKIMEMKKRRSEDVENEDVGGGSGGVDGGGGDAGVGFELKTKSASEMLEKSSRKLLQMTSLESTFGS